MAKIEITKDAILQPGDMIEMHYKVIGPVWLKAVQIAVIESNLEKDPRFDLRTIWFEGENDRTLVMRIVITPPRPGEEPKIQEAGVPVTAIVIAIGAAAAAIFIWLSLGKIYKIVETPAGAVMGAGFGIAAAAVALYFVFKK